MPQPLNDRVRKRMESQRTSDTAPELAVRRALHRRGFRFRVDVQPMQGIRTKPDITFTRKKVAVFIDGCFWHGCPLHFIPPKNNADWWSVKITTNVERDARHRVSLRHEGWRVLAYWEHESAEVVAEQIATAILTPDRMFPPDC